MTEYTPAQAAPPSDQQLSRRGMLAAGGMATAAAASLAVAGCSTYAPPGSEPSTAPSSDAEPASSAAAAPASTASGATSTAKRSSGTPLGPAGAVPVGGGKVYSAQKVVVTQPTAGTYKAFSAVCTHQGCTVNSVSGRNISCPCHGSKFSVTDGSVTHGPAQTGLTPKTVHVEAGELRLG